MLNESPSIEKLRWIMSAAKRPHETGCPWDIKQDLHIDYSTHNRRSL